MNYNYWALIYWCDWPWGHFMSFQYLVCCLKKTAAPNNNIITMLLLCWEELQGTCSGLNINHQKPPWGWQTALRRGYTMWGWDFGMTEVFHVVSYELSWSELMLSYHRDGLWVANVKQPSAPCVMWSTLQRQAFACNSEMQGWLRSLEDAPGDGPELVSFWYGFWSDGVASVKRVFTKLLISHYNPAVFCYAILDP